LTDEEQFANLEWWKNLLLLVRLLHVVFTDFSLRFLLGAHEQPFAESWPQQVPV
jgi:hypothetical protein